MQFLWVYLEDMVGKGLEASVLIQLFLFASASLVTMALPLAILLSSIMTFGSLGENYELVAMKSSGISLNRIMRPLVIFVLFISVLAFIHSNYIMPVANLKFRSLLYDIMHQRPALDFKPGVFYDGIDGYVIRIQQKNPDTQEMRGIQIFDHTEGIGNRRVILAEEGKMYVSNDGNYLVFDMKNVKQYDEQEGPSHPFVRAEIAEHSIRFDLSAFKFSRTDENLFKDHYQMLNLKQLKSAIDTLNIKKEKRLESYKESLDYRLLVFSDTTYSDTAYSADTFALFDGVDMKTKLQIYQAAINIARAAKTYTHSIRDELKNRQITINKHIIEWHRKFTLSLACIVLFFVGAPLGAIIRKGGLGMPVVVSIIIFIFYHIISMTGEKLVKEGELNPFIGMWIGTIVLIPIGAFLTYKSTTDSVLLDTTYYQLLTDKLKSWFAPVIRLFRKKKKSPSSV